MTRFFSGLRLVGAALAWCCAGMVAMAAAPGGGALAAEEFPPISDAERALTAVPGQPNAPAVVLFRKGVVHLLSPLGSQEAYSYERIEVRIKILTDAGRRLGDVRITHHGVFRLQDFEGRTVLPDGTVVPLARDARFEAVNSRLHKMLTTKVAFPAVAVGAILDYHYTIRWDGFEFLDPWVFQDRVPVLHSEATYEVPSNLGVKGWRRDPMQVGIHSETTPARGGSRLRVWADNLPAVPEEPFSLPFLDMAAEQIVLPTEAGRAGQALVPLFRDWSATCEILDRIYEPMRRRDGNAARQAHDLAAAAASASGESRQRAAAEALFTFVRDQITTAHSNGVGVPRDGSVDAVLEHRRGTPTEKALLLASMLAALKIEARLVWVANREDGTVNLEVPNPLWFDRTIVAAEIDGKRVFLDAADPALCFGHIEPGYEGTQAVLFDPSKPEIVTLPESSFDSNVRRARIELTYDDSGRATGTGTLILAGQPAHERTRWKGAAASAVEAWQGVLGKDFPAFDISAVQVTESLDVPRVEVSWKFAEHPEEALGDQATLVASRPLGPVRQQFPLGSRRLSPIAFPYAERDEVELTVHWPAGWRPEVMPLAANYRTFAGAMVANVELDEAHNTLSYHRRFDKAHWKTVTPEQFDMTQQLFEEAQKVDAQALVLARR